MVAVASAAAELHHGVGDGHVGEAAVGYLMVFFAIWWAWVNFTTTAIRDGLTEGGEAPALATVAAGGLLLVFGLWWVYFCRPTGEALVLMGLVVAVLVAAEVLEEHRAAAPANG